MIYACSDMQSKLNLLSEVAKIAELKINIRKTKPIKINANAEGNFLIYGKEIDDMKSFYLDSIIDISGGSLADVTSRISKVRNAFAQLSPVWKLSNISKRTKIKLFNSNVKSTLLHTYETWNMAPRYSQSLQIFVNKCLSRILRVYWSSVNI